MALVQAKYFILANRDDPVGCQVDNATLVAVEAILQSDWRDQGVGEELNSLEIRVVQTGTNTCAKKFAWNGACALKANFTYTIYTPSFLLPIGSYNILMGSSGSPLSRTIAECGINLAEVSC